ncbi:MAG: outer membrane lipoprotein-sorting protein [Candidatus Edwardsbacteria bacterium]
MQRINKIFSHRFPQIFTPIKSGCNSVALLLGIVYPLYAQENKVITTEEIVMKAQRQEEQQHTVLKDYTCFAKEVSRQIDKEQRITEETITEKKVYQKKIKYREDVLKVVEKGESLSTEEIARREKKERKEKRIEFSWGFPFAMREKYQFELFSEEECEGRPCYLVKAIPKEKTEQLLDAKIWVDKEKFAQIKMVGNPAKNPKYVKSMEIEIVNNEVAKDIWLPVLVKAKVKAAFLFMKKNIENLTTFSDY